MHTVSVFVLWIISYSGVCLNAVSLLPYLCLLALIVVQSHVHISQKGTPLQSCVNEGSTNLLWFFPSSFCCTGRACFIRCCFWAHCYAYRYSTSDASVRLHVSLIIRLHPCCCLIGYPCHTEDIAEKLNFITQLFNTESICIARNLMILPRNSVLWFVSLEYHCWYVIIPTNSVQYLGTHQSVTESEEKIGTIVFDVAPSWEGNANQSETRPNTGQPIRYRQKALWITGQYERDDIVLNIHPSRVSYINNYLDGFCSSVIPTNSVQYLVSTSL